MNEQIIAPDKIIGRIQVCIVILFGTVWLYYFVNFISQLSNVSIKELFLAVFTSIAVILTATIVHEYSHLMVARLLKHPSKAHIFKKPQVEFSKDLSKRAFVVIAIAPLVVHLLQLLVLHLLFTDFFILHLIVALALIMGCMTDCYMIYRVFRLYRTPVVLRYKERGIFEVIPRSVDQMKLSK